MGAKPQPAPEGFEVVKVGREWVILITPRDQAGQLTNFGFVSDPRRSDKRVPLTYRRRSLAVTDAYVQQLVAENEALRRELGTAREGRRELGAEVGGLAAAGV